MNVRAHMATMRMRKVSACIGEYIGQLVGSCGPPECSKRPVPFRKHLYLVFFRFFENKATIPSVSLRRHKGPTDTTF